MSWIEDSPFICGSMTVAGRKSTVADDCHPTALFSHHRHFCRPSLCFEDAGSSICVCFWENNGSHFWLVRMKGKIHRNWLVACFSKISNEPVAFFLDWLFYEFTLNLSQATKWNGKYIRTFSPMLIRRTSEEVP